MKRLFFVFLILLMVSCKKQHVNNRYNDGDTKFVVIEIGHDESLFANSIYTVEVIDMNGFSWSCNDSSDNLRFTFTDARNKFLVGDIIKFNK